MKTIFLIVLSIVLFSCNENQSRYLPIDGKGLGIVDTKKGIIYIWGSDDILYEINPFDKTMKKDYLKSLSE